MLSGAGLAVEWLLRRWSERTVVMVGGTLASLGILASYAAPNLPTLILFFGAINGLGQGLVYVTLPIAATYIFPESFIQVAMAIQNTGDGVGLMLFPLLYEQLIPVCSSRLCSPRLSTTGLVLRSTPGEARC